jgi:hypothetical protein
MEGMSSSGGLEIGISCLTGPHFGTGGQKHTSDQTEGAAQEVLSTCQGCCKTVRGIEESPGSRGISRHHLDNRRCYGPQGGD